MKSSKKTLAVVFIVTTCRHQYLQHIYNSTERLCTGTQTIRLVLLTQTNAVD